MLLFILPRAVPSASVHSILFVCSTRALDCHLSSSEEIELARKRLRLERQRIDLLEQQLDRRLAALPPATCTESDVDSRCSDEQT
jgi:hypothetical protein